MNSILVKKNIGLSVITLGLLFSVFLTFPLTLLVLEILTKIGIFGELGLAVIALLFQFYTAMAIIWPLILSLIVLWTLSKLQIKLSITKQMILIAVYIASGFTFLIYIQLSLFSENLQIRNNINNPNLNNQFNSLLTMAYEEKNNLINQPEFSVEEASIETVNERYTKNIYTVTVKILNNGNEELLYRLDNIYLVYDFMMYGLDDTPTATKAYTLTNRLMIDNIMEYQEYFLESAFISDNSKITLMPGENYYQLLFRLPESGITGSYEYVLEHIDFLNDDNMLLKAVDLPVWNGNNYTKKDLYSKTLINNWKSYLLDITM